MLEDGNCSHSLADVHTWTIHAVQLSISIISLSLNIMVTLLCHRAAPIPYPQRRQIAALSFNFALIAAIQVSKNVFLIFSLYNPCLQFTNTITCKLQEFPLFFSYIHGAFAVCIIVSQINKKYSREAPRPLPYALLCSVWQTLTVVVCVAIAMLFTALDKEEGAIQSMPECSALLALRQPEKAFWLLTLLICLHGAAVVGVTVSVDSGVESFDRRSVLSYALRDVITMETLIWQISFLFSGIAVLYRYILLRPCEECVLLILELSFVSLPLICSFLHPLFLIWYVFPIRDATIRVFPCTAAVLPEYALVPPPPVPRSKIMRRMRPKKKTPRIQETVFEEVKEDS